MRRFGDVMAVFNFIVLVGILFVLGFRHDAGAATNLEPFEQTIAYQSQLIRDKSEEILGKLGNLDGPQVEQISRGRFEGIALRLEAIEKILRGRVGQPAGQLPGSE